MAIEFNCFKCNQTLKFSDRVGLREECPSCREDVHVCKNCEFYDRAAYNECRESSADVVLEKERANFCDYFTAHSRSSSKSQSQDLKSAAEALFKKK